MSQPACGGSVQCCAIRIAVLQQDGVPLPGPSNLYVTDAITKFEAVPVFTKGVDMEIVNACGAPQIIYKDMDRFKRYDVTLDLIYTDPELEQMLLGTEIFDQNGLNIGSASPATAAYAGYYFGVSLELWSKRIVNGDLDPVYPYIRWILPRVRLQPSNVTLDNNALPRSYTGYTSANSQWFNGPLNDWNFSSDTQLFYSFTKTLPSSQCGAQPLVHS